MVQRFAVGEILSKSLSTYLANFIPFTLIGLGVNLPFIAFSIYYALQIENGSPGEGVDLLTYVLVAVGLGVILSPIETGAITYGVFQHLRGQRASIGQCLAMGFSRLLPVLGVAIVSGLITVVGFLLLIIPGIIVICMLYVAVPAAVVERTGVVESLARSWKLTRDNRLQIFGLIFLLGIIEKGIDKLLEIALLGDGDTSNFTIYMCATLSTSIVLSIWQSSAACIAYYHLRSMKESVDIEEVASVFD